MTNSSPSNNFSVKIATKIDFYVHFKNVVYSPPKNYSQSKYDFCRSHFFNMTIHKFRFFAIFFVAVLTFDSCHSNSTSPGFDGNVLLPGIGSSFTYVGQSLDSNGNIEAADTITDIFEEVGLPFDGKASASQVVSWINGVPFDTLYVNYESNGDLSLLEFGNSAYPGIDNWFVFPFGSQMPTTVSGTVNENGKISQTTAVITGAGLGTDSVLGKNYLTKKAVVNSTIYRTITLGGQTYSDTILQGPTIYSFSPAIGYITDISSPATRNLNGKLGFSINEFLINYTLK
jgi:hypothetical protein